MEKYFYNMNQVVLPDLGTRSTCAGYHHSIAFYLLLYPAEQLVQFSLWPPVEQAVHVFIPPAAAVIDSQFEFSGFNESVMPLST